MKIDASSVQMASTHSAASVHTVHSRFNLWIGNRRPSAPEAPPARAPGVQATFSERALSAAARGTALLAASATAPAPGLSSAVPSDAAQAIRKAAEEAENDPRMLLIRSLIAMLTGREVQALAADTLPAEDSAPAGAAPASAAAAAAPAPSAGFGLEYDYHEVYAETEQATFVAQGTVRTSDGQEIRFEFGLLMQRSYREETSVSVRLGDALQKDPLVLDFQGTAAELQSTRFAFDLDADGQQEQVPLLGGNRGYLALDLNGNRRIDSGRELFGPASGDGFADLAQHDADGNGWIDENDPVFRQLRVWTPAAQGSGTLGTLADHGVGALYLGHVATPFELRDGDNRSLGTVRASGVYLGENGGLGTLQQIDLTV